MSAGGLREHRLHRPVQRDREAREPRRAFGQRDAGDGAEVAGEHRGAPHVGRRQRGGGGDRVDHHAFERALAQLADEQADQEVLLGGVARSNSERSSVARVAADPLPVVAAICAERRVDLDERQRRLRGGIAARGAQRRVADADPALPGLAREERHRDLDLVGRRGAQALGDRIALRGPAAGRRHAGRRCGDRVQRAHGGSITTGPSGWTRARAGSRCAFIQETTP